MAAIARASGSAVCTVYYLIPFYQEQRDFKPFLDTESTNSNFAQAGDREPEGIYYLPNFEDPKE